MPISLSTHTRTVRVLPRIPDALVAGSLTSALAVLPLEAEAPAILSPVGTYGTLANEATSQGDRDGSRSVRCVEFLPHHIETLLDRVWRHDEMCCDLVIRQAFGNETQELDLVDGRYAAPAHAANLLHSRHLHECHVSCK